MAPFANTSQDPRGLPTGQCPGLCWVRLEPGDLCHRTRSCPSFPHWPRRRLHHGVRWQGQAGQQTEKTTWPPTVEVCQARPEVVIQLDTVIENKLGPPRETALLSRTPGQGTWCFQKGSMKMRWLVQTKPQLSTTEIRLGQIMHGRAQQTTFPAPLPANTAYAIRLVHPQDGMAMGRLGCLSRSADSLDRQQSLNYKTEIRF